MEKIAYIIIAHKDPLHLKRLVKSLNFHSDFYIHIDKKVDLTPFKKELESLQANIVCVSKYVVTWGGFSSILAQKEMLRNIFDSGEKYKKIVCISGLDYPINSNKEIHEFFDKNQEKEILSGLNISHKEPKEINRITNYYFVDNPFLIRNPYAVKILNRLWGKFNFRFKKQNTSKMYGRECDIYFGSAWYAISDECARYVYHTLQKEKRFLRYISTAYVPDELCINTIIFNSRFASNAVRMPTNFALSIPGDVAFEKISPLHYLVYRDEMKTLTKMELNSILKSNKMFFRKSETGKSDSLNDEIDKIRNNTDASNQYKETVR